MCRRLIRWAVTGWALWVLGCAWTSTGWRHFHGDLASEGFLNVKSGYAVSPAWRSEPFAITSSSPVVGRDAIGAEVVYIGTMDAQLVALDAATGAVRWKRSLGAGEGRSGIVSSPTVGDDGGILVLTTTELPGGRLQSSLHKVDWMGNRRWSQPLPDGGISMGSPKAFAFAGQPLALAQSMIGDLEGLRSELVVVRDAGTQAEVLSRGSLGDCSGSRASYDRLLRTWRALADWPAKPGGNPAEVVLEPSPAARWDRSRLLIAMADNLCRVGILGWDGHKLSLLWEASHAGDILTSPVLLSDHHMVFGRSDGKLFAYDADTGVRMWEYDAGEPILSTPSGSAEGIVYAASKEHLHAVRAGDGGAVLQSGAAQRLRIPGPTLSSPVVTAECIYLPAREMLSVSHDFKVRSHNTTFMGNGLSSPAVGADGSIYVVAADGSIWKYKGAN
ncbi:MAG: PQQ-binding-like beta-propeller repeat protein [Hyphomicrobiales bacterium]